MDSNLSFFSLPFGDPENGDISFTTKGDFHHALPSGSLLEADDVLEQFLSADDPLEEPDLNGPTTLHCEICQKKFDNAKKYYGHLRVHSKHNLWTCDKCPNQRFSTKQQLMKHSLTHKPLEKVWRCQQCPMAFEALYRLQQHLFAKHLNYRPHKCDECTKSFQKLSDLKKHQNQHTGLKQHICPICSRAFKDNSNLNRHSLTHSQDKTYQCTGCRKKFKQHPSLKRHIKRCARYQPTLEAATTRQHYCRACGMNFQYKSALLEHCVREHTVTSNKEKKDEKPIQTNTENKSTVDTIVDDILSVEDEYSIATNHTSQTAQNDIVNFDKNQTFSQTDATNADNLMHIEFLKEMNQLHSLDDEFFYNDMDFDSFHSNQVFNNDIDYGAQEKNEILFDLADCGRSIDQDLMNALYHVKADNLPDDLLNVMQDDASFPQAGGSRDSGILDDPVSINDCATIFESDIDLEASTNLAMNLNQLIGENNVQFISTEDDDTFIISLDSGIDAERLSDMLNIDVELINESEEFKDVTSAAANEEQRVEEKKVESAVKIPELAKEASKEEKILCVDEKEIRQIEDEEMIEKSKTEDKEDTKINIKENVKKKTKVLLKQFICKTCDKVFKRNENLLSHLALHDASLRRHACPECRRRFSYRSTLNKHRTAAHPVAHPAHPAHPVAHPAHPAPSPPRAHVCYLCRRRYAQRWMLKHHLERDHERLTPYACDAQGCSKQFYKKSDLDVHKRYHTGERPYKCDICGKSYLHVSHLRRHLRTSNCTKSQQKNKTAKKKKISIKVTSRSLLKPQIVFVPIKTEN